MSPLLNTGFEYHAPLCRRYGPRPTYLTIALLNIATAGMAEKRVTEYEYVSPILDALLAPRAGTRMLFEPNARHVVLV